MNSNKFVCMLALLGATLSCNQKDGLTIHLTNSSCDQPGRRVADGEIPTPADVALDAWCAQLVTKRSAPHGFITIFGSARAKPGMTSYDQTEEFAFLWSKKHGKKYPILTGGGPGIMEAGNKGAKEAGEKSLGFSTYFGKGNEPLNSYTTDGYVFASFAQREADMVDGAVAILIAPGGVGTEWEIYESIAKIQTGKKNRVPVILLGPEISWAALFKRLESLKIMQTISPEDIHILQRAKTASEAVEMIEKGLLIQTDSIEKAA